MASDTPYLYSVPVRWISINSYTLPVLPEYRYRQCPAWWLAVGCRARNGRK